MTMSSAPLVLPSNALPPFPSPSIFTSPSTTSSSCSPTAASQSPSALSTSWSSPSLSALSLNISHADIISLAHNHSSTPVPFPSPPAQSEASSPDPLSPTGLNLEYDWLIFCWLVTHPLCAPFPDSTQDKIKIYSYIPPNNRLSRSEALRVLAGFFSLSPPLQHESHAYLLASLVNDSHHDAQHANVLLSRREDPRPKPEHVRWDRIIELAFFIKCGLQAAATRTGSAGQTTVPTPKWLKMQTRVVAVSSLKKPQTVRRAGITWTLDRLRTRAAMLEKTVPDTLSSSSDGPDAGIRIGRNPQASLNARCRDERCLISGDPYQTGLVTAHIFPYSVGCYTDTFDNSYFWFFLKLWLGPVVAQTIWNFVGGENINRIENLITLTATLHSWFGEGSVVIEPVPETFIYSSSKETSGPPQQVTRSRNAVVVRVHELVRGLLRRQYTTRVLFPTPTEALHAAHGDLKSLDDDDADARSFNSGACIVISRGTRVCDRGRVDLTLPDANLLAVFAWIMRMRAQCLLRDRDISLSALATAQMKVAAKDPGQSTDITPLTPLVDGEAQSTHSNRNQLSGYRSNASINSRGTQNVTALDHHVRAHHDQLSPSYDTSHKKFTFHGWLLVPPTIPSVVYHLFNRLYTTLFQTSSVAGSSSTSARHSHRCSIASCCVCAPLESTRNQAQYEEEGDIQEKPHEQHLHIHALRLTEKLTVLEQAQSNGESILLGHERYLRKKEKRQELRAYARFLQGCHVNEYQSQEPKSSNDILTNDQVLKEEELKNGIIFGAMGCNFEEESDEEEEELQNCYYVLNRSGWLREFISASET